MNLGQRISEYRKAMNLTQDQLAKLLEVSNQAVSKWETEQCYPDIQLLPRLADIFSISLDVLFGRESAEKTERAITGLPWQDDNTLRVVLYVGQTLVADAEAGTGVVVKHEDPVKSVTQVFSVKATGKTQVLSYEGDVEDVLSMVSVSCGNVSGNVDARGSVTCGNVSGDVDAGGGVCCGEVNGNVDAGGTVSCGDVGGNVDAGGNVTCGNVDGDVDAGKSVYCLKVSGDVDAGHDVYFGNDPGHRRQ